MEIVSEVPELQPIYILGGDTTPPTETIVVVEADRPIMTTPLDDYTVTEGLLLLLLLWLIATFLWDKIRSVF